MHQQNTKSFSTDSLVSVWKGALAGCIATIPMTAIMMFLQRQLPLWQRGSVPPKKITMGVLRRIGVKQHMSRPEEQKTAWAAHFGYGTSMGALYGIASSKVPGPSFVKGIVFALAVWTVSYLGWLPAMDLPGAATEESPEHNAQMIAAHVVWGATLGGVLRALKAL
jgi:putative membrane protein